MVMVTMTVTVTGPSARASTCFTALSTSVWSTIGGTGMVSIQATAGNGQTRTLTGTLVFNGDGTATVTVNGHTHTFPL